MLRLLTAFLFACPLLAHAADDARERMQSFAKDLRSLSGEFEQSVTGAKGSRGEPSKGTLALKAPRQFRWQTTSPFEQLVVADGSRVWVYDPDLMQASVRSQSTEEAQSPLTVLTDLSRLEVDFTASDAGTRDGLAWLRLVSKAPEPEFAYVELGFDSDDALARMRFEDALGNTTEIRFSGWKRNPKLADGSFAFTPPAGVDVVGDPGKDAEVIPLQD